MLENNFASLALWFNLYYYWVGAGFIYLAPRRSALSARLPAWYHFCSPLFLAYGTCASAQVPRNLAGAWLHAQCAPQIKINVDYLLDPTKKYIVSQGNLY